MTKKKTIRPISLFVNFREQEARGEGANPEIIRQASEDATTPRCGRILGWQWHRPTAMEGGPQSFSTNARLSFGI